MKHTKKSVIESLSKDFDEMLESIKGDCFNPADIIEVDLRKQTVTVKFSYHVVLEDDYIGLASY